MGRQLMAPLRFSDSYVWDGAGYRLVPHALPGEPLSNADADKILEALKAATWPEGYEWAMRCPHCGGTVRKKSWHEPWKCPCGWTAKD